VQFALVRDRCRSHLHRSKDSLHYEYIHVTGRSEYSFTPVDSSRFFHSSEPQLSVRFDLRGVERSTASWSAYIYKYHLETWPRYKGTRHRFLTETSTAYRTRDELLFRLERVAWHDQRFACRRHLRAQTARHDQARPGRHLGRRTIPRTLTLDLLPSNHLSST
jgi:hypothetical protein